MIIFKWLLTQFKAMKSIYWQNSSGNCLEILLTVAKSIFSLMSLGIAFLQARIFSSSMQNNLTTKSIFTKIRYT